VDLATGSVRWTRPVGGSYYWSALAYGDGRLYLLNFDGRLTALSPATGATLWTTQLDQYSFSTAPVYHGGSVYLTGAGSGMTAYAVRASDGALQWSKSLPSGAGSPAVDDGTVYVSMVCQHAVALDRASGATRWARSRAAPAAGRALRRCTAGGCTRSATTARSTMRRRARPSGRPTSRAHRALPTVWPMCRGRAGSWRRTP
jgi:outer membrane protein assembly factor BamB